MKTLPNYDTQRMNGASEINYYVNCFDRYFTIIFDSSVSMNELPSIYDKLEENYYDWQDDDKGYCCEEYMIENLEEDIKKHIVVIIYEREDEE